MPPPWCLGCSILLPSGVRAARPIPQGLGQPHKFLGRCEKWCQRGTFGSWLDFILVVS